jgi:hypothetical protein
MGSLGRKAVWGAVVALWIMVPAPSAFAANGQGKVDGLLQESSSGSRRSVIIRVRPEAKDRILRKFPHRGRGASEHKFISAFTAQLDGRQIAALANDPDVLSVSADAEVSATARAGSTSDVSVTGSSTDASASVIQRALGLQNWFNGSTVTVAIIDSGSGVPAR